MRTIRVVTLATLLMASDVAMPRSQAQQPGVNRIDPQRHDYQLIRQPRPIAERRFEIEFLDAGVETFAFTFG